MKIKEFYNKYINWIVIILVCFIILKGCQSCSMDRRFEYKTNQTEQIIDSLNNHIDSLNDVINLMNKDIEYLNASNNTLNQANKNLTDANKHYRDANNVLVNTNKQLTEQKDTIR